MRTTLVLLDRHDSEGSMYRALHLDDDGSLVIEGQDLGDGVAAVFGADLREYEFERRLDAPAVIRLRGVLGIGTDEALLPALAARVDSSHALERVIAAHDIPSTFWSRIGD
jgi:hypothetical protein